MSSSDPVARMPAKGGPRRLLLVILGLALLAVAEQLGRDIQGDWQQTRTITVEALVIKALVDARPQKERDAATLADIFFQGNNFSVVQSRYIQQTNGGETRKFLVSAEVAEGMHFRAPSTCLHAARAQRGL